MHRLRLRQWWVRRDHPERSRPSHRFRLIAFGEVVRGRDQFLVRSPGWYAISASGNG